MEQPFKIDAKEKLAELARVVSSGRFRRSEKQRQILEYLVKEEIAGNKPTENAIAADVYAVTTFGKDDDASFVRDRMRALRESLKEYYAGEGKTNRLRIELMPGSYQPVFRPWPPLEPVGFAKSVPGRSLPKFAWIVAAGAVLASTVWFIYDRPCNPAVSIADPQSGAQVGQRRLITVTRKHEQIFCRCRDYLVVEPTDLAQLWVQGELPEGRQAYLSATFGNDGSAAGTRFTVFVLTTKSEFAPGHISQMAIAGARMSPAIEVSLEKP